MKSKMIFLVRHGESEANIDTKILQSVPDHKINLTVNGYMQAHEAGKRIKEVIEKVESYNALKYNQHVRLYYSSFVRAKQTADSIVKGLSLFHVEYRQDPRLREQDWGNYSVPEIADQIDRERDQFGAFHYRIPGSGESGADVYDRMSGFLETLFRDFQSDNMPEYTIISTHGFTLRIFLMRWFHWTVETFEKLANPKNGEVVIMSFIHNIPAYTLNNQAILSKLDIENVSNVYNERYKLISPLKFKDGSTCLMEN